MRMSSRGNNVHRKRSGVTGRGGIRGPDPWNGHPAGIVYEQGNPLPSCAGEWCEQGERGGVKVVLPLRAHRGLSITTHYGDRCKAPSERVQYQYPLRGK
jgi:hypothetical protein